LIVSFYGSLTIVSLHIGRDIFLQSEIGDTTKKC